MARIDLLELFIISYEGGFVNDPRDRGGATMSGVTFNTFKDYRRRHGMPEPTIDDLKKLSTSEWEAIFRELYWDPFRGDQMRCQGIANLIVDWAWCSGVKNVAKMVQKMLSIKADGIIGPQTIAAINAGGGAAQHNIFLELKLARGEYLKEIAKKGSNSVFYHGWLRRWEAIHYDALVKNNGIHITW